MSFRQLNSAHEQLQGNLITSQRKNNKRSNKDRSDPLLGSYYNRPTMADYHPLRGSATTPKMNPHTDTNSDLSVNKDNQVMSYEDLQDLILKTVQSMGLKPTTVNETTSGKQEFAQPPAKKKHK